MIQREKVGWTKTAVYICTKCSQAMSESDLSEKGNPGENLKNHLKTEIRNQGLAKECRVMTSSCLNVCKPELQAFVVHKEGGKDGGAEVEAYVAHPEKDRAAILDLILAL